MPRKRKLGRAVKELTILVDFLDEKVAELERRVQELETPIPVVSPVVSRTWVNTSPNPPYTITFNNPSGPLPDEPPFTLVPAK